MAAKRIAATASIIPNPANSFQATVEHVEESEGENFMISLSSRSRSSTDSSHAPSLHSATETTEGETDEDEVEEIVPQAPLCRRDVAHEVATSLWGMVAPRNFGRVMPGIYRSSFPKAENLSFLKTLGLKSILTLVPEHYSPGHASFVTENGIQHFSVGIEPNKNPFVTISQCNMTAALSIVLNRANHPLLIHCNKGKHRTGCVVGCLRKTMGWDLATIFTEYHHYAGAKARALDERFMELFDERAMLWLARLNYFIPAYELINDSPVSPAIISTRLRG